MRAHPNSEGTPLGASSWSAAFTLEGSVQQGQLQLLSPLGSVLAQALWKPGSAIWRVQGRQHTAANLQDLLAELLNLPLPPEALFAWLGGEARAAEGWSVDLSQYPNGRIQAHHDGEPTLDVRIILE